MNRTFEKPVSWSITISPPYRHFSPEHLYAEDIPVIRRWFRKFSKHYILFSEFDDESRLHYHGTIYINDMIKFHKTRYHMSTKVGFIKIKLLKSPLDLLRWTFYIRKDYHFMYKDFPFIIYSKKIPSKIPKPLNLRINIMDFLTRKGG